MPLPAGEPITYRNSHARERRRAASTAAAWTKNLTQIALVSLIYLLPGVQALLPLDDPDIWWHLRTGQWILRNGWVPATDPFSSVGYHQPWVAYSWLFEIVVYGLHAAFGLSGLIFFTAGMGLIIAFALHRLVRGGKLAFRYEIIVTAMALVCMKSLMSPRPWLFSILFLVVEVKLLFDYRRSGSLRRLYWLPLVFVLWANIHVQFVYGLAVLFFAAIEPLLASRSGLFQSAGENKPESARGMLAVFASCWIATLATPYHVFIYRPVIEYAVQTGVFQNIAELHPMFFRNPADWIFLTLFAAALLVLGWRRDTSPFPYLLLILGALLSFRARRDVWVGAVAAAVVIADPRVIRAAADRVAFSAAKILATAIVVAIVMLISARLRKINEPELQAHVRKTFPVDAVAFVRSRDFQSPLFNHLDWGGFLIWSLPEFKVAMDGRTNIYGDARIGRHLAVWSGRHGWSEDPELARANLIIADHARPLTDLLRGDRRFKIVYEDQTAVVFAAVTPSTAGN